MLIPRQDSAAPPHPAPAANVRAPDDLAERPPPHGRSRRAHREPTMAQLAWTILERRWTVVAVTAIVLVLARLHLFVAPNVYESSILVQVESRTRPAAAFEHIAPLFIAERSSEGEIRIMKSRTLLEAVVEELALDVSARPTTLPFFADAFARRHRGPGLAPVRFGLERYAWGGERIRVGRLAVSSALEGEPLVLTSDDSARYRVVGADGAVLLEGEVGVLARGGGGERTIELLVSELSSRPGMEFVLTKRRVIDAIESLQAGLQISEPGRDTGLVVVTLAGQDPERVAAILDSVAANYLRQSVERTSAQAAKMLELLDAQLPVLKANMDKAERAINAFRRTSGAVNLSVETEAMLGRVGEIDRAIAELELRRAELTHRYTDRYPEIGPLTQRAERLREQRAALEARMRALPDMELASTRLTRQARVASELYLLVLNRAEELRIIRSGWLGDVRILEKAAVPYRPISPKPTFTLVLGALLGVGLGVALVLVRSALDDGVRDPDEIEASIGVPVFATIPRSSAQRRLARRGRRGSLQALSVAEPADAAAEDLRGLRTGVQFALMRSQNNVVAVGGLAPQAGKSFVSVNLAHLLAAAGGRVLLVDADLRRGVLHRYFGLAPAPGLADVVGGTVDLEAALRRTDAPNLDLLPAGGTSPNPSELLAGAAFQRLLTDVRARYDAVVVDTPPILSVADSAIVARHAGVHLLVLRAGEHSLGEIAFVLRRLAQSGVTVRGVVLNCVRGWRGRYGRGGRYRRYDAGAR